MSFKKRAPRAVKEIRAFATQAMVRVENILRSLVTIKMRLQRLERQSEATYERENLTNLLQQGTKDVRLDPQLNKKVWESGVKGVPFRIRVRISRKRNDEEGAKEKLYSYVQAVNVKNPKGLHTVVVEDS